MIYLRPGKTLQGLCIKSDKGIIMPLKITGEGKKINLLLWKSYRLIGLGMAFNLCGSALDF